MTKQTSLSALVGQGFHGDSPFGAEVSAMPGSPPTPRVSGLTKKVLHKDFASEGEKKVLWFIMDGDVKIY